MTTPNPQPGQEQRMELKASDDILRDLDRWEAVTRNATKAFRDALRTRPAADPGEYGELRERLRELAEDAPDPRPMSAAMFEAIAALETQAATIARLREGLEQIAAVEPPWGPDAVKMVSHIARAALSPNPTSP